MHWFTIAWWKYVFSPVAYEDEGWQFAIRTYICRMRGHPCGVIWFNPYGWEPDMTCRNCGDDLDA